VAAGESILVVATGFDVPGDALDQYGAATSSTSPAV
jgi:hypothetical protein